MQEAFILTFLLMTMALTAGAAKREAGVSGKCSRSDMEERKFHGDAVGFDPAKAALTGKSLGEECWERLKARNEAVFLQRTRRLPHLSSSDR